MGSVSGFSLSLSLSLSPLSRARARARDWPRVNRVRPRLRHR